MIARSRRTPLFRLCAALVFLCCAGALKCAAQSASSAKADAASRATVTYQHGMSALQKGDLDSARADFEKVVRLAPQSPEGHNSLGWVLLAQDQVDSAIKQFQSAVKLKPDFAQAHVNFANALIRKGDLPGALRESKEAAHLAQNDSETHRTLGRARFLSFALQFNLCRAMLRPITSSAWLFKEKGIDRALQKNSRKRLSWTRG